jgi:uracil-DNA glycosylase
VVYSEASSIHWNTFRMSTGHSQVAPAPNLPALLREVRACTLCAPYLPLGPRPVLQAHETSRILIAGQAPGRKVHASGVPFDDASGERLRSWMGVSRDTFYDPQCCAILPMGFCYPGTGRSGDVPPRPECAPTWRAALLAAMPRVQLTLVIGQYAMAYHLPQHKGPLTEAVQAWRSYGPDVMLLPHPSPRNNGWLKRNPWFEAALLPVLRARIAAVLGDQR